jgi:peroxiredoxin (alkyl hydroperoxide reductase subunit C)
MKKSILFVVMIFAALQSWAQDKNSGERLKSVQNGQDYRIPHLGEVAPSFKAQSTTGVVNFPGDYGASWKIIFSHPQDFTPVCSSEILELANLQDEFDRLGARVIVISADPLAQHLQWKKAMEEMLYKGRASSEIRFPIVDDENLEIAKKYGMIHPATNSTKNVRGVFIIDPDNVIRIISFYPMEVGRSTEELIRTLAAIQTTVKSNVLTPANWQVGNDVLIPYPPNTGSSTALAEDYYQTAWFMWYKKGVK